MSSLRTPRFVNLGLCALVTVCMAAPSSSAKETAASAKADYSKQLSQTVEQGVEYLASAQAEDGSWGEEASRGGVGITALVTTSLLASDVPVDNPTVAKGLANLEQNIRDDGGIYSEGSRYRNYETSLAILCLSRANADKRYDKALANAEKFVKKIQWDEEEGFDRDNVGYGGAGYGSHSRPDLSNTAFLMEALHALGNDGNDPAMYRALAFVSKCQNLPSEDNPLPKAAKNPDGGFYYTPIGGGSSQAGETPDGGLRSYGSMTYSGLKSMIYAGVDRNDPRVKAALEWITKHYTLTENPGMGSAGHYYYLHTFAKALHAIGGDAITDADGKQHNWKAELVDALAKMQEDDGSWQNKNERWLEGNKSLSTGFALLSLAYCGE